MSKLEWANCVCNIFLRSEDESNLVFSAPIKERDLVYLIVYWFKRCVGV